MIKKIIFISIFFTLFNFCYLLINDNGFRKLYYLISELRILKNQQQTLNDENKLLAAEKEKLARDQKYIEKYLRKNHGYIGKNELILEFHD